MAKYFNFKNNIDNTSLKLIANEIKNGKIVIFPTETVYGIGTNGLIEDSVKRIFEIKNRNLNNPINLLVKDIKMIEDITKNISEIEYKIMENFFPGPLTLILEKNNLIPNIVTANSQYVGVRISDNIIVQNLLEYCNTPIAAPSANISGNLSGTNIDFLQNSLLDNVDYIIDCGKATLGLESTIVKVIDNVPHILRPGNVTKETLEQVCGKVIFDNSSLPSKNFKHYQTLSKVIVVYSKNFDKILNQINSLYSSEKNPIILAFEEHIVNYQNKNIINLGSLYDLNTVSRNLFTNLNTAQSLNPSLIIIEGLESSGLGFTIMNRLLNVANNNFIEL